MSNPLTFINGAWLFSVNTQHGTQKCAESHWNGKLYSDLSGKFFGNKKWRYLNDQYRGKYRFETPAMNDGHHGLNSNHAEANLLAVWRQV